MRAAGNRLHGHRFMAFIVLSFSMLILIPFTFSVEAAPYCATYAVDPDPPGILPAGQPILASMTVTNCGTLTWVPGKVNLAYHWYRNNTYVTFDGLRTFLPSRVEPGQQVSFAAYLITPNKPGTYALQWDLVEEGVKWFQDQGVPRKDQMVKVSARSRPPDILAFLCQKVDCAGTTLPHIARLYPPDASGLTPGQEVAIVGKEFGWTPGSVKATGQQIISLDIIQWRDNVIVAKVPLDITGVTDQKVKLHVETADHKTSNEVGAVFVAAKEFALLLPNSSMTVRCATPSGSFSDCDPFGDFFQGFHETACCASGESDYDRFSAGPFKNGWVVHSYEPYICIQQDCFSGSNPDSGVDFSGVVRGLNHLKLSANWATKGVGEYVGYFLNVILRGPRGTLPLP